MADKVQDSEYRTDSEVKCKDYKLKYTMKHRCIKMCVLIDAVAVSHRKRLPMDQKRGYPCRVFAVRNS